MPSPLLPISSRSSKSSPERALLVKSQIEDDPSTNIFISSQFEDEKAMSMEPLVSRAASYNGTIATTTTDDSAKNYQQRRRRIGSENSLSSLSSGDSPQQSFSEDVGHAAAETFLVTRLSLKLLTYLGYNIFSFCSWTFVYKSCFVFVCACVELVHGGKEAAAK